MHRDLKPANVLLHGQDFQPKVADLGTAMEMAEGAEEYVAGSGTPLFQAPEVLRREEANHSCDLWSYGCLLCCLSTFKINPYAPIPPAMAVGLVAKLELQPRQAAADDSPFEQLIKVR